MEPAAGPETRHLLRRYMLGSVLEAERAQVEEKLFHDDSAFALLEETEDELIDDYLLGRLSKQERRQFEEHFLDSPRRRERLAATRLLLRPRPRRSFIWAAAASILVAGLGLLLYRQVELGGEVERLTAELRRERDALALLDKEIAGLRQPAAATISFLLRSGLTRAAARPVRIAIPAGEHLVQLDLERPEAAAAPSSFRIRVETVDGSQIWSQEGPRATIPSSLLPPNDYVLTLLGAGSGGVLEEIADYSFRVVGR